MVPMIGGSCAGGMRHSSCAMNVECCDRLQNMSEKAYGLFDNGFCWSDYLTTFTSITLVYVVCLMVEGPGSTNVTLYTVFLIPCLSLCVLLS